MFKCSKRVNVAVKCHRCGKVGHIGKECPAPPEAFHFCYNCGKEGHGSEECPEPKVATNYKVCRNCGEMGHFASECTLPKHEVKKPCPVCGKYGHTQEDCPSDMAAEEVVAEKKPAETPKKAEKKVKPNFSNAEEFPSL